MILTSMPGRQLKLRMEICPLQRMLHPQRAKLKGDSLQQQEEGLGSPVWD